MKMGEMNDDDCVRCVFNVTRCLENDSTPQLMPYLTLLGLDAVWPVTSADLLQLRISLSGHNSSSELLRLALPNLWYSLELRDNLVATSLRRLFYHEVPITPRRVFASYSARPTSLADLLFIPYGRTSLTSPQ